MLNKISCIKQSNYCEKNRVITSMKSKKIVNLNRAITTLVCKNKPMTMPLTSLQLDTYIQPNVRDTVYSYNKEIDYQVKCGSLSYAHQLFDEMRVRDFVTWNTMISGYNKCGFYREGLLLYKRMVLEGFCESSSTFSSVLSMCSNAGWYGQGLEVHSRAIVLGFSLNMFVCSAVIDLYMRMGFFDVGLRVFSGLHERSLGVWNLVLRGCCDSGRSSELFGVFSSMKKEGVKGNGLTFCYLIRGCGSDEFVEEGRQLHCYVVKNGWCEVNIFVANALVDFYSACGCLSDAEKAFEVIPPEDVISWNSIVSAYGNDGFLFEALELFSKMQFWGKKPSVRSFVGLLTLCLTEKNLILGNQIHCFVMKTGFDVGSAYVQSALIDMYGKCGEIENSVSIFQGDYEYSLESCNSMMTSLLQYDIVEDVFELFAMMLAKGIRFDEVSVSATLKALSFSSCASFMGCTMLHCCVIKSGFVSDSAVSCSLIDAYSRSGHVKSSRQIFEELSSVNVVSFTSIINAYARNGMGMQGLGMLKEMTEKGVKPDKVTFLCVLNGCNHSGLVEEGKMVFDLMKTVYGIHPDRKHYSCMVDLFGRAGLLEDAEELLKQAPRRNDSVLWSSLLRSCRIHRNEDVGRRVTDILMDLEPEDPEIWLQASNFYAEIGEFETSSHIREVAVARKMRMEIGNSLIETRSHF